MKNAVTGHMSEEEARKILLAAGVAACQKMAGFIPLTTDEKISPVDISKSSGGVVPGGIIDTFLVSTWDGSCYVDKYEFDDGAFGIQDSNPPY